MPIAHHDLGYTDTIENVMNEYAGFFGEVTGPKTIEDVTDRLPRESEKMQNDGTPFNMMRYIHNGADNCPPTSGHPRIPPFA